MSVGNFVFMASFICIYYFMSSDSVIGNDNRVRSLPLLLYVVTLFCVLFLNIEPTDAEAQVFHQHCSHEPHQFITVMLFAK